MYSKTSQGQAVVLNSTTLNLLRMLSYGVVVAMISIKDGLQISSNITLKFNATHATRTKSCDQLQSHVN